MASKAFYLKRISIKQLPIIGGLIIATLGEPGAWALVANFQEHAGAITIPSAFNAARA